MGRDGTGRPLKAEGQSDAFASRGMLETASRMIDVGKQPSTGANCAWNLLILKTELLKAVLGFKKNSEEGRAFPDTPVPPDP